jgi:hypothetical protein
MIASLVSIVAGSLSAGLWIAASAIRFPPRIWIAARVGGGGPSEDVDQLLTVLRRQSRLNGAAAACAALASAAQVFALAVG